MYILKPTTRFKQDSKRAKRRGKDLEKLKTVIKQLQAGQPLAPKHRDHPLAGTYSGYRECHIEPDWLLIYCIEGNNLILVRTGTHSDLF
jgi:mRNA interferase YafQ